MLIQSLKSATNDIAEIMDSKIKFIEKSAKDLLAGTGEQEDIWSEKRQQEMDKINEIQSLAIEELRNVRANLTKKVEVLIQHYKD